MSAKKFQVEGIDHVEICVPDRFAAAEWYREMLGFEIVQHVKYWADNPNGPLMVSSDGASTMLALFNGEPEQLRDRGIKTIAFRVDGSSFIDFVNNVDALGLVGHRGEEVTGASYKDHDSAFSIYFCDPYGTPLEITTYDHEIVRMALG